MRKSLTRKLREAKERIKQLEDKLTSVEKDRQAFRDKFILILKKEIENVGANTYTKPSWRVEDLASFINGRDKWWW